ncbi:MAG: hypothetical protein OXD50_09255 [Chloroflexi bacterium]|nr:hypothetical protein [Chloroflexota bacterium]
MANNHDKLGATLAILERSVKWRATLGADRAYDTRDFVWDLRALG